MTSECASACDCVSDCVYEPSADCCLSVLPPRGVMNNVTLTRNNTAIGGATFLIYCDRITVRCTGHDSGIADRDRYQPRCTDHGVRRRSRRRTHADAPGTTVAIINASVESRRTSADGTYLVRRSSRGRGAWASVVAPSPVRGVACPAPGPAPPPPPVRAAGGGGRWGAASPRPRHRASPQFHTAMWVHIQHSIKHRIINQHHHLHHIPACLLLAPPPAWSAHMRISHATVTRRSFLISGASHAVRARWCEPAASARGRLSRRRPRRRRPEAASRARLAATPTRHLHTPSCLLRGQGRCNRADRWWNRALEGCS